MSLLLEPFFNESCQSGTSESHNDGIQCGHFQHDDFQGLLNFKMKACSITVLHSEGFDSDYHYIITTEFAHFLWSLQKVS